MLFLKACPRCQTGDLYLDEDDSKHCMQCGHIQHAANSGGILAGLAELVTAQGGETRRAGSRRSRRSEAVAV